MTERQKIRTLFYDEFDDIAETVNDYLDLDESGGSAIYESEHLSLEIEWAVDLDYETIPATRYEPEEMWVRSLRVRYPEIVEGAYLDPVDDDADWQDIPRDQLISFEAGLRDSFRDKIYSEIGSHVRIRTM